MTRQAGWTILQYWFFFYSNPWRSGFHGVNEHESNWEMVTLYLYEDGGQLAPEWAAYASHDFHGDDLRRRWDDTADLTIENGHPVVHAGAGSHSSYFHSEFISILFALLMIIDFSISLLHFFSTEWVAVVQC